MELCILPAVSVAQTRRSLDDSMANLQIIMRRRRRRRRRKAAEEVVEGTWRQFNYLIICNTLLLPQPCCLCPSGVIVGGVEPTYQHMPLFMDGLTRKIIIIKIIQFNDKTRRTMINERNRSRVDNAGHIDIGHECATQPNGFCPFNRSFC